MAMPAMQREWTVDLLDALEDDGQRYEIIDGELFVTPSPIDLHQFVVGELHARLREYLKGRGLGKPVVSPSDVRRGDAKRNRVRPDVYVVRLDDGNRPPYPYDLRDLLLAVEVVSPDSVRLDYTIKRELYLREGVGEYWVIDPVARHVSRWKERGDTGEILSERIAWFAGGVTDPFVLALPAFFDDAFA